MVGVVLAERRGQINLVPDCLENGERQTFPSKLEVVVDGWG